MKWKPATYARYSSDLQRKASIEDQERRCDQEIARRGWPAARRFFDEERPGSVAQSPGYQALVAAARAGEVNVIVVEELPRLTRDPEALWGLWKRLQFWGCHLVSLFEGMDTVNAPAAAGPIIHDAARRGEGETRGTASRTRRGLEGRVRAHMHAGGAIYGYRTRAVHADRPGDPPGTGPVTGYEYVIHEEEARIIRLMFEWYADGQSTRAIAAALNGMGVPSPGQRWRNRTGLRGTWSHTALYGSADHRTGILNNERYIGRLVWNRTRRPRDPERDGKKALRINDREDWVEEEAPELRIVPQELWDRVKARQRARSCTSNGTKAVARTVRLLSGILRCGKCGAAFTIRGATTYRCAAHYDRGTAVCDSRASVPAGRAEAAVLSFLGEVFCSDRMMSAMMAHIRRAQERTPRAKRDRGDLHRQIADLEAEAERLVQAIGRGVLVEKIEERMRWVEARLGALREELARERQEEHPGELILLPSAVRAAMGDLQGALRAGETEGVKAAMRPIVKRINVQEVPRPDRVRPSVALELSLAGEMAAVLGLPNSTSGNAQDWI